MLNSGLSWNMSNNDGSSGDIGGGGWTMGDMGGGGSSFFNDAGGTSDYGSVLDAFGIVPSDIVTGPVAPVDTTPSDTPYTPAETSPVTTPDVTEFPEVTVTTPRIEDPYVPPDIGPIDTTPIDTTLPPIAPVEEPTVEFPTVTVTAPREPVEPYVPPEPPIIDVPPLEPPVLPPIVEPPEPPPEPPEPPPEPPIVEPPPPWEPPIIDPWEPPRPPIVDPQPPVVPPVVPPVTPPPVQQGGNLNPGWIPQGVTPFYQTTNPTQAQYYWGAHPYMRNMEDLANYNYVPNAPQQPWGYQTTPPNSSHFNPQDLQHGVYTPMPQQTYPQVDMRTLKAPANPSIWAGMIPPSATEPWLKSVPQITGPVTPTTPTTPQEILYDYGSGSGG